MFIQNLAGQFGNRVSGEEEAGDDIHIRRRRRPFLALDRVRIEDRPYRAAPVAGTTVQTHGGGKVVGRDVLDIGRVAITI
jgi:hypothetical protein